MIGRSIPPSWSYNPSAWRHRLPVLGFALLGCGIAVYLTLYQVNVLHSVWEPFFGIGSKRVLKESLIARAMPIPDASLGAFAYLLEALCEVIGGEDRWRSRPWIVLLLGLIACGLGISAIILVICQAVLVGTFCTLCLTSAACSLLAAWAAAGEVLATLQYLRGESAKGHSVWRVMWGRGAKQLAGSLP